jgi:drug/metabolite transporter, DME family
MGFALAFVAAFCFSITNIVLKKGMTNSKDNGIWIITFINVIVLGFIFALTILVTGNLPSINLTGLVLFAISSIFINVFGRILLYKGIRQIGSSKAVAIKNSAPIFTIIFAMIIIKETITFWPSIGIGLIMIGLLLLGVEFFKNQMQQKDQLGYWIALGSAIGFGLGQGISKYAMISVSNPFLGVFLSSFVALLCLTAIEPCKGNFILHLKANITNVNKYYIWAGLLTSLALLFFYLSIYCINVSYSVAILAADPVFTVVLGKFFLKKEESISPTLIFVTILVFIGAGIVSSTGK